MISPTPSMIAEKVGFEEVDADTRRFYERHGFTNVEDGTDWRMLCYVGLTGT